MHHAEFYVAAATALPVLVIAGVIQTNFPRFFEGTAGAYVLGAVVVLILVAGETAALAALASDRDTGWGRATVCIGLGVSGFWLVGPMLAGRFLPERGDLSLRRFLAAVALAVALLVGAGVLALRAVGLV